MARRRKDRPSCPIRLGNCYPRFEEGADEKYAEVRTALERASTLIGANDLLIATHALSLRLALVTDNAGKFSRVPELGVENWLAP